MPTVVFSLRDVSERYRLTYVSKESVRSRSNRLRQLFTPVRSLVTVDETVEKMSGYTAYIGRHRRGIRV
ncbi:MAG: hypothetical protein QXH12_04790 [Candidatus Caldarchaeum sp.]